jgi:ketosteroid isomerase-like protein
MHMHRIRFAGLFAAICLLLSISAFAQNAPDKAYMDKIWAGWSTLNPEGQTQFYAQGPHVFFDDEPLKYDNWDQYKKTTATELAEYKSGTFRVNNDATLHRVSATTYWGTSTVDFELTKKDGKTEKGTLRWTVIFEKQNGKWLIVHEHVSAPLAS